MVHVTCDLCGKELHSAHDPKYVVKIEIYAAHDPDQLVEADLDEDNLEAVSQLLCDGDEPALSPDRQTLRYDLCSACRVKFVQNPLQAEPATSALPQLHCHFSQN